MNARRQGLLGAILKPSYERRPVSLQFGELETGQWVSPVDTFFKAIGEG